MNEELDDPPTQRSFGVTSWMGGLMDDWVEFNKRTNASKLITIVEF